MPDRITIYEAASAPESLFIILIGTLFVLPSIAGYTLMSYYIFRGKATELRYDCGSPCANAFACSRRTNF